MTRKRPHLFGADEQRNVLPRFTRDILPSTSAAERAAWRTIKPHLVRFLQRRRGIISSTAGAGAAIAAEFIRGKLTGNTPRGRQAIKPEILGSESLSGTTDSESKSDSASLGNMPGEAKIGDPMEVVHGDKADAADPVFGRDAESEHAQKAAAASLWSRAPRIYDDEIIVRLPFIVDMTTAAAGTPRTFTPTLAAAGPPIVPAFGSVSFAQIQLNNIFTPYPTDTTFKPRGYSWYSQLYNLYQVLETRYKYMISSVSEATSSATPGTTDLPIKWCTVMTDNAHTGLATPRDALELGWSNGADKSIIIDGPHEASDETGLTGTITNTCSFSGTWHPAKFDDLQTNITFQPMTGVGANPNWTNYLDVVYSNYNTVAQTVPAVWRVQFFCEFLVHFKKINMTKYKTAN